jgi:spermidine/putrescine transport system permease protein
LIAGHTVLGLGFSIPMISARFAEFDYSIIEASLDLGATLNQTFMRIVIPMLLPTIVAAGLLVFIISLDDFLISFFCVGSGTQTLSLYIFSMIRSGISPTINALSTLLLLASSIVVLFFSLLQVKTRIF